jgi:hypothetical protein
MSRSASSIYFRRIKWLYINLTAKTTLTIITTTRIKITKKSSSIHATNTIIVSKIITIIIIMTRI